MSSEIFLDHVGVAVRSLSAADAAFRRLGFTPTPLSLHEAPPAPGAAPTLTGSGNHCIMLRDGYLELIGIADPDKRNQVGPMLARYEGLHILAFGCNDADAARNRIAEAGFPIAAPIALERDAPWGRDGRETRRAAFANAHLAAEVFPEARSFVIQHKTPDVVWQPHQMSHPNGAVALTEAWLCPADPDEAIARYARLTERRPREEGRGQWLLPMARGALRFFTPEAFAALTGHEPPGIPGMCGMSVAVTDLAEAKRLLTDGGIAIGDHPAGLLVPASGAHGAAILFTQDNRERN